MRGIIQRWALSALVGVGIGALVGCGVTPTMPAGAPTASGTTPTATTSAGGARESVSGRLTSVDKSKIILGLPDGSTRTFVVLPEDIENLNISELETKVSAGASVRIFYETVGGTDYAVFVQSLAM